MRSLKILSSKLFEVFDVIPFYKVAKEINQIYFTSILILQYFLPQHEVCKPIDMDINTTLNNNTVIREEYTFNLNCILS